MFHLRIGLPVANPATSHALTASVETAGIAIRTILSRTPRPEATAALVVARTISRTRYGMLGRRASAPSHSMPVMAQPKAMAGADRGQRGGDPLGPSPARTPNHAGWAGALVAPVTRGDSFARVLITRRPAAYLDATGNLE